MEHVLFVMMEAQINRFFLKMSKDNKKRYNDIKHVILKLSAIFSSCIIFLYIYILVYISVLRNFEDLKS